MRVVVALGGNALLQRGEPMTAENQLANVKRGASALAPLCSGGHEVIITHGNGPQVGLLALQNADSPEARRFSLDVLCAETEGMIGYLVERELMNVLGAGGKIASLLTLVEVDRGDPAFSRPSKPIGPNYRESEARDLAAVHGWTIVQDGAYWRRAVASPRPIGIRELAAIEVLLSAEFAVICTGGGGVPVAQDESGRLVGVEAIIDKDWASAVLARDMRADRLVLLTDVSGVYKGWRTPAQSIITQTGPGLIDPNEFESGSMRPKLEASLWFVKETGKPANIGRLEELMDILADKRGTKITRLTGPASDF